MLVSAIVALAGVIYALQTGRISKIEEWKDKRPSADQILTKNDHLEMCDRRMEKIYTSFGETRGSFDSKLEKMTACLASIKVDIVRMEGKLDTAKAELERNARDHEER